MFEAGEEGDKSRVNPSSWDAAVLGVRKDVGDPMAEVFDSDTAPDAVEAGGNADRSGVVKLGWFVWLDEMALSPCRQWCGPNWAVRVFDVLVHRSDSLEVTFRGMLEFGREPAIDAGGFGSLFLSGSPYIGSGDDRQRRWWNMRPRLLLSQLSEFLVLEIWVW